MIRLLVSILVFVINTIYRDRPYPRFYVLETVARVPYFSYLSVLHLYETLGLWRKADWLKVHFAESWNELHHLLIMESLGGDAFWGDRILAKTTALIYYWIITFLYFIKPRSAYHFMELVEKHAYISYHKFLTANEVELKAQTPPVISIRYYRDGDLYMFDEFQTSHTPAERRPTIENLYDVFVAIRDDEMEHVKTMQACQKANAQLSFKSPHTLEMKIVATKFDVDVN
ncbi:alternative oxidase [Nostoc sp. FACHB-280]|uniref:alternative oxidase n=1 Tax=Nostoc sp. FACHB-280 TaxID=2692839 RepID=UPI00168B99D2|nr:alternative oxidase [Nostoc sp. FACHB-280]MBD2496197.1 plastoquinol terminal oxidase [Nostoc sp. FACHB-280]